MAWYSKKKNREPASQGEVKSDVKVLGSACRKCNQLEANAKEALLLLGLDPAIEHVSDFSQIALYGVMTTPGLVIDGKVVSRGKVLSTEEIVNKLKAARQLD